jgi:uncharacterized protein DUF3592
MEQKQRYMGFAVAGIGVAALGGIFGTILLLNAIGVIHGSAGAATYAILTVLALAIGALGAVLAVYGEHQWHHLPGGSSAWAANEGWRTSDQSKTAGRFQVPGLRSINGGRRVHAPATVAIQAVIFLAVTIFLLVGTLNSYSGSQRSSYTQAHGVSETVVAGNVQNIRHTGSHGSVSYTYQITVTSEHPAVGDGNATVYGDGTTAVQPGQTITVLVDPRQTDYAEIPGAPFSTTSDWVVSLLFTIIFGIMAILITRKAVLMLLRHRRVSLVRPYANV